MDGVHWTKCAVWSGLRDCWQVGWHAAGGQHFLLITLMEVRFIDVMSNSQGFCSALSQDEALPPLPFPLLWLTSSTHVVAQGWCPLHAACVHHVQPYLSSSSRGPGMLSCSAAAVVDVALVVAAPGLHWSLCSLEQAARLGTSTSARCICFPNTTLSSGTHVYPIIRTCLS